ncbi:MAG: hypothetical protein ACI9G1_002459 [Pirellulaceae bacterium]
MHAPHISTRPSLSRRHFLRGTGACLALPFLEAMLPTFRSPVAEAAEATGGARRFVAMNAPLGFHVPHLIPATAGTNYSLTPYLKEIGSHRQDFTVFSGLSHPNQNGNNGHASEMSWLTSAQRPGLAGFKNTISLDQLIARQLAGVTRLPYLALTTQGSSLSWTANGVQIPAERSPAKLFKTLFVDGTKAEVAKELRELRRGRSILDTVSGDAKALHQKLGPRDRQKLDEYFTSLRDLERRIQQSEEWSTKPKPPLTGDDAQPPKDIADKTDILAKQRLMYHLIALALQTDSTRSITFQLGAMNAVPSNIPGVKTDWHNLSHHGRDEAKIKELQIIEQAEFIAFNEFLTRLKGTEEAGGSLLDHTAVLFGSNLGNASSHDWHNLPIILAGGGFKHGSHLAYDAKNNAPFANLFVSLAQRMGVEVDSFGSSTAAGVRGLEMGS